MLISNLPEFVTDIPDEAIVILNDGALTYQLEFDRLRTAILSGHTHPGTYLLSEMIEYYGDYTPGDPPRELNLASTYSTISWIVGVAESDNQEFKTVIITGDGTLYLRSLTGAGDIVYNSVVTLGAQTITVPNIVNESLYIYKLMIVGEE